MPPLFWGDKNDFAATRYYRAGAGFSRAPLGLPGRFAARSPHLVR